ARMIRQLRYLLSVIFFFSSRRRHTRFSRDWSSDVCSSDLRPGAGHQPVPVAGERGRRGRPDRTGAGVVTVGRPTPLSGFPEWLRSEERRVGKECRWRGAAYHQEKYTKLEVRVQEEQWEEQS